MTLAIVLSMFMLAPGPPPPKAQPYGTVSVQQLQGVKLKKKRTSLYIGCAPDPFQQHFGSEPVCKIDALR